MSKVHEGQVVVVEGSLVGETIIVTKFAYDSAFNLKYLGEAKAGSAIQENKFFIQKFIYDSAFNLIDILNATNRSSVGADQVTVDVTTDAMHVVITLPNAGDFTELNAGDSLSLITVNNTFNLLPIKDTNQTNQVRILKNDIPANILATMIDEVATPIATANLLVQLNDDKTKAYKKRRWDHRERYIYA